MASAMLAGPLARATRLGAPTGAPTVANTSISAESPGTGPEPTAPVDLAPPGTGPGSGSAALAERVATETAANLHQHHLSLIKQAGHDNSPAFAGVAGSHRFNPDGSNDPHQSNRLGLAVQQTAGGVARREERWRDQGFGKGMHMSPDQKRVIAKA